MTQKAEYFECKCDSSEHTLRFVYDDEDDEIYTQVFLHAPSFFQRVWQAIKYVFGYKCKYGHWDCTLLKKEDIPKLIALLERNAK